MHIRQNTFSGYFILVKISFEFPWWLLLWQPLTWFGIRFHFCSCCLRVCLQFCKTLNSSCVSRVGKKNVFSFSAEREVRPEWVRFHCYQYNVYLRHSHCFPLTCQNQTVCGWLKSCTISKRFLWHTDSREFPEAAAGRLTGLLKYEPEIKSNRTEIRKWLIISHTCKRSDCWHESKHTAFRWICPCITEKK